MTGIEEINHREIEKRKERIRRVWDYKKVDHIPLGFFLEDFSAYTLRELCEDGELQFKVNVRNIDRLLRLLPDDYVPAARVWPGYMTVATMFGLEVHWSDDPNQAPGIQKHCIFDISQVHGLQKPDAAKDGLMPFNLKWLRYFCEALPPDIAVTGIDLGGPLNTAKDLFDTNLLYTAFYDNPDEYHFFLNLAVEVQIDCYREIIRAVGDINRLTCIDFDPFWAPEGRKGFVSDDVCATISPEIFKEFSVKYNNRIFRRWRGGRLHNCGPNPSLHLYLHHNPEINGLNCSFKYSKNDLAAIKREFREKGIVEFMFDNGESVGEIVDGYEHIAEMLTPDVVAIPLIWLNESWTDDDIREVYNSVLNIAERYARDMKWRK
jgi:hypothetical protein